MQYTLRGIPPRLDQVIRERARATGKSLNEVALAALAEGSGLAAEEVVRRDLSDIVKSEPEPRIQADWLVTA